MTPKQEYRHTCTCMNQSFLPLLATLPFQACAHNSAKQPGLPARNRGLQQSSGKILWSHSFSSIYQNRAYMNGLETEPMTACNEDRKMAASITASANIIN